ncbi:MAG TPA: AEC family transporter [Tenuifilaceae bacterium]|nr:AEC family transporter [Tenuifilaceae bacterium]
MATEIILKQLLVFAILIGIGAIAFWRKIITSEIKDNLSRIVIDVTLPFLILTTFANMESSETLLKNGILVFILAFLNLVILYVVGFVSSKVLGLNAAQKTVHSLHTMFGNIVFLAFPLLDALFPNGIGVFYGAVYQLASNMITFTFGVYKLSSGTQKSGLRSLINLNTTALIVGAIILIVGFKLPYPIKVAFEGLGKCTGPLSMVYIGAMLAGLNIKKTIFKPSIYVLSFNKLILAPMILASLYFFTLKALGIEMSSVAFYVLILQAAMPCQTIVVVLSHRFNGDYQLAGANLFVSTILSVFTLPFIYFFLEWLTTTF